MPQLEAVDGAGLGQWADVSNMSKSDGSLAGRYSLFAGINSTAVLHHEGLLKNHFGTGGISIIALQDATARLSSIRWGPDEDATVRANVAEYLAVS